MDPCLVWIRLRLPEEELGSLVRDFTGQAKFEQWNNPQVAPPWLDQVAVIYANERLDDDLLATMPNLKWVHFSRAGVNAYITPALNERPIQVTSSIGIHGVALAELGLASIFALATRLPECWEAQRRKEWSPGIVTEQIGGKTLGIIGLGTIGTELARMAKGLGMRVIANKRTPGSKPDFVDELGTPEYLPKLLSQSDFVVMCIPSIPSCERMLGEKEFRSMKKSAFLINLTGGRVPEERALVKALREGWIAGAILNAVPLQPLPKNSELWVLPNVTITPRLSGSGHRWDLLVPIFRENLKRFMSGEPLRNLVNKELGY